MTPPATLFVAGRIVTIDPARPSARAVLVREGRILGVGDPDELRSRGPCNVDGRFADRVLMPGLVEGHSHLMEGGVWRFVYVGYYDRHGPDGTLWTGLTSIDAVVARLAEA